MDKNIDGQQLIDKIAKRMGVRLIKVRTVKDIIENGYEYSKIIDQSSRIEKHTMNIK